MKNAKEKWLIKIQSFNPFEARYPGHKVVSYDTLLLIKRLRQQNIQIIVLPEDKRPVEYLFRKGVSDLFSSPMFWYIVSIPTNIAINLISDAIIEMFKKRKQSNICQLSNIKNIFINYNNGSQVVYLDGSQANKSEVDQAIESAKRSEADYARSLDVASPDKDFPLPIFLEHTGQIVGWGNASIDVKGIRVKSKITDDLALRMIVSGQLKGFSIAGISQKSICSVCKTDYILCNHIAGETYKGINCTNKLMKVLVTDISVVSEPVNKDCYFEIKPKKKYK